MATLLTLHGPNLGRLGSREPSVYGSTTLAELDAALFARAEAAGHSLQSFQSDAEHELIQRAHRAADEGVAFILLNPAGLSHTSVALRDAMLAAAVPFIEVHLSNPAAREAFRQHSYFSDIAYGVVAGFGTRSYEFALDAAMAHPAVAG